VTAHTYSNSPQRSIRLGMPTYYVPMQYDCVNCPGEWQYCSFNSGQAGASRDCCYSTCLSLRLSTLSDTVQC
jgi:hypothetical protein